MEARSAVDHPLALSNLRSSGVFIEMATIWWG